MSLDPSQSLTLAEPCAPNAAQVSAPVVKAPDAVDHLSVQAHFEANEVVHHWSTYRPASPTPEPGLLLVGDAGSIPVGAQPPGATGPKPGAVP